MRYKIVYDRPGRMRVRCGAGVFTAEQGYGIAGPSEGGQPTPIKLRSVPSTGAFLSATLKATDRPFSPFLTV